MADGRDRARMNRVEIRRRPRVEVDGWPAGLHPLLARVYAARGLTPTELASSRLADLGAPSRLHGVEAACTLLCEAIAQDQQIGRAHV